jgi:hypothetical protein
MAAGRFGNYLAGWFRVTVFAVTSFDEALGPAGWYRLRLNLAGRTVGD